MKKILTNIMLLLCAATAFAQERNPLRDSLLCLGYDKAVSADYSTVSAASLSSDAMQITHGRQALSGLAGLLPGVNITSSGNLPDNGQAVYVRGRGSFSGNSVMFIVDGIERNPSFISAEEVENITVLKDAAAIAIYGNRGADGVIVISTKKGRTPGMKIGADYSLGVSTPFAMPQMADGLTYANAVNEALANDGLAARYTDADLRAIAQGSPLFPSVDWQSQVLRKTAFTHDFNLTLEGNERRFRYFVYANYNGYDGLFNNTGMNEGYSTQYQNSCLKLRTNLEAEMTRTTKIRINMMGRLSQTQQPYAGTYVSDIYTTPAIAVPLMTEDGVWARSELFGNPLAKYTQQGYSVAVQRTLLADLSVVQDLSMLTEGLSLTLKGAFDNSAVINESRSKTYKYAKLAYGRDENGDVERLEWSEYGNYTDLSFSSSLAGGSNVNNNFSVTAMLDYDRTFGKHGVGLSLIASADRWKNRGKGNVYSYIDYIVRASYDYDHRYLLDLVGTYSGSAFLEKGKKFRFYPAVSAAWIASNEDFLSDAASLNLLKLRASWGVCGYDARLGYGLDTPNNSAGAGFIAMIGSSEPGMMQGSYPSYGALPETDYKANLGLDIRAFGGLEISADLFRNHRKHIKVSSSGVYSSLLGVGAPYIFNGETLNWGGELSVSWSKQLGDWFWHLGGTFSYTKDKILEMGEEYHPYEYQYRTGHSITSLVLYRSDGLYGTDDFDSQGNLLPSYPQSTLDGKALQPGDVRYKDLNDDGVIDVNDKMYVEEYHSLPSAVYGLQLGAKWKGFGVEATFDGRIGQSVQLTASSVYWPLYNDDKNISMHYYRNRWTPDNQDARYPRLTTLSNANNYQGGSDFWVERADWFKLRSLYLYYSLRNEALMRARFRELTFFVRGLNLFSIDRIKIFDPESISLGYPSVRTVSLGVKCTF
ncbi:MAG: SusC/RagA family TonB-linked outer membrane protein [Candidatus Cryptobacteroides sp.]